MAQPTTLAADHAATEPVLLHRSLGRVIVHAALAVAPSRGPPGSAGAGSPLLKHGLALAGAQTAPDSVGFATVQRLGEAVCADLGLCAERELAPALDVGLVHRVPRCGAGPVGGAAGWDPLGPPMVHLVTSLGVTTEERVLAI